MGKRSGPHGSEGWILVISLGNDRKKEVGGGCPGASNHMGFLPGKTRLRDPTFVTYRPRALRKAEGKRPFDT